jgi:hypothetical protein
MDGLDDFLGPHGGPVNVGFIHPDSEPFCTQILHHPNHLLLILSRITDENVRVQIALLASSSFLIND